MKTGKTADVDTKGKCQILSVIKMDKKISTKIKKKIDNIINLKNELKNWRKMTEDEVFLSIKAFEKTPRDEGSSFYNDYFNDNEFAEILLDISKEYQSNNKLNICIISSLGNMMNRYDLKETERIYEYFLSNIDKKGVSAYTAIYFTKLERFYDYPDKWSYIMSVKDMKPAKIGEASFETIIKREKENIPDIYKSEISGYFKIKAEKANNEYGKKHYLTLAEAF